MVPTVDILVQKDAMGRVIQIQRFVGLAAKMDGVAHIATKVIPLDTNIRYKNCNE